MKSQPAITLRHINDLAFLTSSYVEFIHEDLRSGKCGSETEHYIDAALFHLEQIQDISQCMIEQVKAGSTCFEIPLVRTIHDRKKIRQMILDSAERLAATTDPSQTKSGAPSHTEHKRN